MGAQQGVLTVPLSNDFSLSKFSLLSQPGVASTGSGSRSKSAVRHSQGKAYSVKLFTYTFKTWQLSILEITLADARPLVLTRRDTRMKGKLFK